MATNEQDDYEAVLQDLSNTMALKQEDDEGNKVAKAQFLSVAASILAPLHLILFLMQSANVAMQYYKKILIMKQSCKIFTIQ